MKKLLNIRNILSLAFSIVVIVVMIIYVAIDSKDITFSINTLILSLVGSLIMIASIWLKMIPLKFISTLLFTVAAGFQCYASLPTLSDIWNQVNFKGGNHECAIMFLAFSVAFAIIAIVLQAFEEKAK